MYECLVCTHPAPLPNWCAILRGYVNEKCCKSRLIACHETPEWGPARCTAAKARVAVDLSDALAWEVTLYILELLVAALSGGVLLITDSPSLKDYLTFFDIRFASLHFSL